MTIPAVSVRRVCGLVLCGLLAVAVTASAQITINILSPTNGQTRGDPLIVNAAVNSAFTLTSVEATVAGQTIPLTFGSGTWSGSLPLTVSAPNTCRSW